MTEDNVYDGENMVLVWYNFWGSVEKFSQSSGDRVTIHREERLVRIGRDMKLVYSNL